jgi:hypothetical protein
MVGLAVVSKAPVRDMCFGECGCIITTQAVRSGDKVQHLDQFQAQGPCSLDTCLRVLPSMNKMCPE